MNSNPLKDGHTNPTFAIFAMRKILKRVNNAEENAGIHKQRCFSNRSLSIKISAFQLLILLKCFDFA